MKRVLGVFVAFVAVTAISGISHSTAEPAIEPIIFVNASATGLNDGSSWSDAFTDLQDALAAAQPGQSIRVASGIYKPTAGIDREISFEMKQGVNMYGGFEGNEDPETFDLADRDFVTNETILSGDLLGNDNDNVAYNEPTRGENSYTVIVGASDAVLDGFTISGGNSNGAGSEYESLQRSGAGMYNLESSPTVINCTFASNSALYMGAGMFNSHTIKQVIANCAFSDNAADTNGGGMFNSHTTNQMITNCAFSSNAADMNGGGMYGSLNSDQTIISCDFSGNRSLRTYGGGMYDDEGSHIMIGDCNFTGNSANYGGGLVTGSNDCTIANCTFTDNEAKYDGGGILNADEAVIANCTFAINSASRGGGFFEGRSSTIISSTFSGNSATLGGGMFTERRAPSIVNCTFSGNTATDGGGMYNSRDVVYSTTPQLSHCILSGNTAIRGGGIYDYICASTITNCTISRNSAETGGGIYSENSSSSGIRNSIIWGNTPTQIYYTQSFFIRYSNVQGSAVGTGNINADPLFADPDNGDFRLKSQFGRWDPVADDGEGGWVFDDVTSPSIDAGDPTSIFSDEPEPNGGRINMGAYGNTSYASKGGASWLLPGDATFTCIVDEADLIFIRNLLGQPLQISLNWRADVNNDGCIDILDLVYARNRLGSRCEE